MPTKRAKAPPVQTLAATWPTVSSRAGQVLSPPQAGSAKTGDRIGDCVASNTLMWKGRTSKCLENLADKILRNRGEVDIARVTIDLGESGLSIPFSQTRALRNVLPKQAVGVPQFGTGLARPWVIEDKQSSPSNSLHPGRSIAQLRAHAIAIDLRAPDKAVQGVHTPDRLVTSEWQELLQSGLQLKAKVLQSSDFKTAADASLLLGIGEPAIRKRIREGKLFALRTPVEGDYRIPLWALDEKVSGAATQALQEVADADLWRLYHFMVTPCGSLDGLRPFECLLSREHLPPGQAAARAELASQQQQQLRGGAHLLDLVLSALRADMEDGPQL